MNMQEIFTTVANHLRKQGRGSFNGEGCTYRGEGGTMCAVGCLIKDEFYSTGLEGENLHSSKVLEALRLSGVDVMTPDTPGNVVWQMLNDLQCAHDDAAMNGDDAEFRLDIEQSLSDIARDFNLTLPERLT